MHVFVTDQSADSSLFVSIAKFRHFPPKKTKITIRILTVPDYLVLPVSCHVAERKHDRVYSDFPGLTGLRFVLNSHKSNGGQAVN